VLPNPLEHFHRHGIARTHTHTYTHTRLTSCASSYSCHHVGPTPIHQVATTSARADGCFVITMASREVMTSIGQAVTLSLRVGSSTDISNATHSPSVPFATASDVMFGHTILCSGQVSHCTTLILFLSPFQSACVFCPSHRSCPTVCGIPLDALYALLSTDRSARQRTNSLPHSSLPPLQPTHPPAHSPTNQSNMVHPLSYDYNATAQIAAATLLPNLRLFQVWVG